MAKKKTKVSVNALENSCKNAADIIPCSYQYGDGELIEFEVRPILTFEESLKFVKEVVDNCIIAEDLEVVSVVKDYMFYRNVMTYYANFTMPNSDKRAYEIVMSSMGIIKVICDHVDQNQLVMLKEAIGEQVDFEKKKMIAAQTSRLNEVVGQVNQFTSRMEKLFGDVDGEQMANFITGMTSLSQQTDVTAKDIAEAIVNKSKEE